MGWRDFAATDMSKVVAVLPFAAIEQHGPHRQSTSTRSIDEGYIGQGGRARTRRNGRCCSCRSRRSASRTSTSNIRHADLFAGNHHARLDRDRRQRGARRLPQADLHEFARRQRAGHRHGRARIARPSSHARGARRLAPARLSRRHVLGQGARARHPWRRRRDLADARLQARDSADGAARSISRARRSRSSRNTSSCA